jgi:hypothetical protein
MAMLKSVHRKRQTFNSRTNIRVLTAWPEIDFAALIGITERFVGRGIEKLQNEDRLCRVAPAKSDCWGVLE